MINMDEGLQEGTVEEANNEAPQIAFKTPILLIGKKGHLPRKVQPVSGWSKNHQNINLGKEAGDSMEMNINEELNLETKPANSAEDQPKTSPALTAPQKTENSAIVPYKEPSWSGLPESSGKPYAFEILKNGSIIETIDLMKKPFWVVGRLLNCDISMQHPTISRYHAVIQYKDIPSEDEPPGFYVYDLGSTHGTFVNSKNNKLKPRVYVPIRVGHIIRLGCSQRSFILTGPEDDQEDESELSVTELKQLREKKIKEHEEKIRQAEIEMENKRKRDEDRGIDWGMGDDADDDEDITENPYASTTNEELYLDDPKKALRGFFEREGLDLEYDCTEQGMGQFLCKVDLPLDDEMGRPIVAEALHRGKKKEAVVQCALEACRILDRFGVLRQSTHESKKRKTKNWEEHDYYDSDEDTFLDRTGTIEKKRQKRMKFNESEKAETYERLIDKERNMSMSIAEIEKKLAHARAKLNETRLKLNVEEDSLDAYMKGLDEDIPDKQTISKLRLDLVNLKKSYNSVIRLINLVKPANLPPLIPADSSASTSGVDPSKHKLPIFGKRIPVKFPAKPIPESTVSHTSEGVGGESDEEDVEDTQNREVLNKPEPITDLPQTASGTDHSTCNEDTSISNNNGHQITRQVVEQNTGASKNTVRDDLSSDSDSSNELDENRKDFVALKKLKELAGQSMSAFLDQYKRKVIKIIRKLQRILSQYDGIGSYHKVVKAKEGHQVTKWIDKLINFVFASDKLQHKVATDVSRVLADMTVIVDENNKCLVKIGAVGQAIRTISWQLDDEISQLRREKGNSDENLLTPSSHEHQVEIHKNPDDNDSLNMENVKEHDTDVEDRKKKKNQKRNEQRQHKAELEKQRGYEEDASRENYNMWLPPNDQSGDGRTTLNEKYGY